MKKDQFESFVRENREQFDLHTPQADLWYQIDQKLPRKNRGRIFHFNIMGIAASVVLLIGLGIGIGYVTISSNPDREFYAQSSQIENFPEVERYYLTQISNKKSELQDLGLEPTVEENLQQLDEVYNELKEEFLNTEGTNKGIIINAMIENYQTKIEILELILNRSRDAAGQNKTMEDETINI